MGLLSIIQAIDENLLTLIQQNASTLFLDKIMPIISFLGNAGLIWIAAGIVMTATKKHRKMGIAVLLSLVLCALFGNILIKPLIGRIRPCDINGDIVLLIKRPHDFSFPSGHTMASFGAAVTMLIYNRKIGAAAILLAVLIGFSRLYLYVHYPSDVLAGAVLGTIMAFISACIVRSAENRIKAKKHIHI
jgi:undecaprenyl-diphosphatase